MIRRVHSRSTLETEHSETTFSGGHGRDDGGFRSGSLFTPTPHHARTRTKRSQPFSILTRVISRLVLRPRPTVICPPPRLLLFQNVSWRPNNLAPQSSMTCSSSVHAGEQLHYPEPKEPSSVSALPLLKLELELELELALPTPDSTGPGPFPRTLTLNPGFDTEVAIISAKIDSKFVIAGKYAKNLGCAHWVRPGMILVWKSDVT
jgi:hypothetical protein